MVATNDLVVINTGLLVFLFFGMAIVAYYVHKLYDHLAQTPVSSSAVKHAAATAAASNVAINTSSTSYARQTIIQQLYNLGYIDRNNNVRQGQYASYIQPIVNGLDETDLDRVGDVQNFCGRQPWNGRNLYNAVDYAVQHGVPGIKPLFNGVCGQAGGANPF